MRDDDDTDGQVDSAGRVEPSDRVAAHVRLVHRGSQVHDVPPGGLLIGRRVDGAGGLAIDDDRMSRRHARVERLDDGWHVVDVASRNGGFVDGRPFGPDDRVAVADGAVVRLGDSLFVFRLGEAPPAQAAGDDFPGASAVAAQVRLRLRRLAQAAGHVLVVGETGTGKERAARSIARGEPERPFVPQNCAELNHDLARSELFGHLKGAFTGATGNRTGLVEAAADGVLFLDEIGELSLELQAEVLRFVEDGSYRVVGATALRRSTARIVAATNVDLDEAVRTGRFRRDLLARLRASNQPLELPALRDRRDDILDWAQRFLAEVASGWAESPWTAGAAECLVLYPWPDNLRELRGVMRALGDHRRRWPITSADLPPRLRDHRAGLREPSALASAPLTPAVHPRPPSGSPVPATRSPTRADIEHALQATGGRMRTAAVELGIDRRKLYRLCESHGIAVEAYRPHGGRDN